MERTKTIDGRRIKYRGLTWGEKKRLKENGFDFNAIDESKNQDALVDEIIQCGMIEPAADELDVITAYKLFYEIIKLTLVGAKASKNSKRR